MAKADIGNEIAYTNLKVELIDYKKLSVVISIKPNIYTTQEHLHYIKKRYQTEIYCKKS